MPNRTITEVRIVQRTTYMDRQTIRPKPYAYSEIFITTADGRQYYSRTWDVLQNSAHERANQAAAFQRRRAHRNRGGG